MNHFGGTGAALAGSHDTLLVMLSIAIAVFASYTALDLGGRIRAASGPAQLAWLATAAVAMGGGIWSMHFVAMLAFVTPWPVTYDYALTLLSLFVAIFVTGMGFIVISQRVVTTRALIVGGVVMGLGVSAMHYTGMAAMRMPADLRYDKLFVALSVLIAVGAAVAALWFAYRTRYLPHKLMAAALMGFAISGMHYTAMAAAIFTAQAQGAETNAAASLGQISLALGVSTITFVILGFALITSIFDGRFAVLAEREAIALRESEERFRTLFRNSPLPLHALDPDGCIQHVSDAWLQLLGYTRAEVIGRRLSDFMTPESGRLRDEVGWPSLLREGENASGNASSSNARASLSTY